MAEKLWRIPAADKALARELAAECGIDPLAALILSNRGVTDPVEIDAFLAEEGELSSPLVLLDMDKAAGRIRRAVEEGERIAVYGDYDCDGVTATAILYSCLTELGADALYYIPSRSEEGYGMNRESVERLRDMGVRLIVTVDNGVSAVDETAYAAELGMEVVVTDHHLPGKTLPPALAVVDPHRPGCPSPYKDICGAGVAFKLAAALMEVPAEALFEAYADLAAIGTVADVMPLTGENRVLVKEGLKAINRKPRPGIAALLEAAGLAGREIKAGNLAFGLGPRINAAGRMGAADRAVRLLLETDPSAAAGLAAELQAENVRRQQTEQEIVAQAAAVIEEKGYAFQRVILVEGEGWHPGIVGIAAARLMERYGRPCIVLSVEGDRAVGSGRSLAGFHLFEALSSAGELLEKYGGHELAGGLTLSVGNIEALRQRLNAYAAGQEMPFPVLKLDCKLNPAALSVPLARSLDPLAPFGSGNPEPVFGLLGMKIENILPLAGGRHVKLFLSRQGAVIQALLFGVGPADFPYEKGETVDAAVQLSVNIFREEESLTVQVRALRPAGMEQEERLAALRRYEAYRRGEWDQKTVPSLLPGREDAALVYRSVRDAAGGRIRLSRLARRLAGRIQYEKLRVAADALQELGILHMEAGPEDIILSLRPGSGRVDLGASRILQALRAAAQYDDVQRKDGGAAKAKERAAGARGAATAGTAAAVGASAIGAPPGGVLEDGSAAG